MACPGQIAPGRRSRLRQSPTLPLHRAWHVRRWLRRQLFVDGESRAQTDEGAENFANLAKTQARIKELHQPEDVTLGRAGGIPPAAALMCHQKYLALGSAVFEAVTRAIFLVQLPGW